MDYGSLVGEMLFRITGLYYYYYYLLGLHTGIIVVSRRHTFYYDNRIQHN